MSIGTQFRPGSAVIIKAGRDAGRAAMVYAVVSDKYCLIVDGDIRKIDKPKLKNIRHLRPTGEVLEDIAAKIAAGQEVFDAHIRRALRQITH